MSQRKRETRMPSEKSYFLIQEISGVETIDSRLMLAGEPELVDAELMPNGVGVGWREENWQRPGSVAPHSHFQTRPYFLVQTIDGKRTITQKMMLHSDPWLFAADKLPAGADIGWY